MQTCRLELFWSFAADGVYFKTLTNFNSMSLSSEITQGSPTLFWWRASYVNLGTYKIYTVHRVYRGWGDKGKDKVHPRIGHEGPEVEYKHSSTLSLTSALDGVGVQHHAPAALRPGKTRYPLYRRLGGPQGRSGQVRKISAPTGIRSPDRPASSESLYLLSYPGPRVQHLGGFHHFIGHEGP